MKKIKLLTGLSSLAVLSGVIAPLTSCAATKETRQVKVIDSYKDQIDLKQEWKDNGDLLITITCKDEARYVEFLDRILIGDKTIKHLEDYTFDSSKGEIVIKSSVLAANAGWITIWPRSLAWKPEPGLNKIEITTEATNKNFSVGETFNHNGLVVKGQYITNGETYKDITERCTFTSDVDLTVPFTKNDEGSHPITVTYQSKSVTYDITVGGEEHKHSYIDDEGNEVPFDDPAERSQIKYCSKEDFNDKYLEEITKPEIFVKDMLMGFNDFPKYNFTCSEKTLDITNVKVNENNGSTISFHLESKVVGDYEDYYSGKITTSQELIADFKNIKLDVVRPTEGQSWQKWNIYPDFANKDNKWEITATLTATQKGEDKSQPKTTITNESTDTEISNFKNNFIDYFKIGVYNDKGFTILNNLRAEHFFDVAYGEYDVELDEPSEFTIDADAKVYNTSTSVHINKISTTSTNEYLPMITVAQESSGNWNTIATWTKDDPVTGDLEDITIPFTEGTNIKNKIKITLQLKTVAPISYDTTEKPLPTGLTWASDNPTNGYVYPGRYQINDDIKINVDQDHADQAVTAIFHIYDQTGTDEYFNTINKGPGEDPVILPAFDIYAQKDITSLKVTAECTFHEAKNVSYSTEGLPEGSHFCKTESWDPYTELDPETYITNNDGNWSLNIQLALPESYYRTQCDVTFTVTSNGTEIATATVTKYQYDYYAKTTVNGTWSELTGDLEVSAEIAE